MLIQQLKSNKMITTDYVPGIGTVFTLLGVQMNLIAFSIPELREQALLIYNINIDIYLN